MFPYQTNQFPYTDESTREASIANMCDNTLVYGSLRKEIAMATLRKRRGSWYARVQWWVADIRKEKSVPLKTKV